MRGAVRASGLQFEYDQSELPDPVIESAQLTDLPQLRQDMDDMLTELTDMSLGSKLLDINNMLSICSADQLRTELAAGNQGPVTK